LLAAAAAVAVAAAQGESENRLGVEKLVKAELIVAKNFSGVLIIFHNKFEQGLFLL